MKHLLVCQLHKNFVIKKWGFRMNLPENFKLSKTCYIPSIRLSYECNKCDYFSVCLVKDNKLNK